MEIPAKKARTEISVLSFIFIGIILTIFIFQLLLGKFEDQNTEAWAWISPNILPVVGLIIGNYWYKNEVNQKSIDRNYFRVCKGCLMFYFLILLSIVLIYPFTGESILEFYKRTNVFLVPLQSIICGILGVFFIKSNKDEVS